MDQRMRLYRDMQNRGVRFYTWDLGQTPAVTMEVNGQYAIFMDFSNIPTAAQEQVILAHEAGHVSTGSTHSAYSPFDLVQRHENRANRWAYNDVIPYDSLRTALHQGIRDPWDLADHFGVTQDFLQDAVSYYQNAQGLDFA